jgi:very-short-patch-repair endonuclease
VVADAVQQRLCRLEWLAEELAGVPRRHSGALRLAVSAVALGIRSVGEGDLRDLLIRAGLPAPLFNASLFAGQTLIAVADAWWHEARLAVEVDSREWHLSPDDWERTLSRHATMTGFGITVLHFTPRQIRQEPAKVAGDIRAALSIGRAAGGPAIRAVPATG